VTTSVLRLDPGQRERFRGWGLLGTHVRRRPARVLLLAALVLAGVGLQLVGPQLLRGFIDAATAVAPLQLLSGTAGAFLAVAVCQQALSVGAAYVAEDVGWAATNALREDLAAHCLELDLAFHAAHPPGEMIERLDGDVSALANFFSRFVLLLAANALLLVGVLVLLFAEDFRVGTALAAFAVIAMLVLSWLQRRSVPYLRAYSQAGAALFAFLEDHLAGLEDLRARGAGFYLLRRFHERVRDRFAAGRQMQVTGTLAVNGALVLFALGNAIALGLGAYLFQRGEATLGTVYMLSHYAALLNAPLRQLTDQWQDYQRATAGLQRITELVRERSALAAPPADADNGSTGAADAQRSAVLPPGALSVVCDRVSFVYPDADGAGDAALRDLRFDLGAGRVLGVLGRTGSGKTTLARLLTRLNDPTAGAIRLQGVDLRRAPLDELRRRVALVTQEVQLFHASVRDNLTLFDRSIRDPAILRVVRDLGLEEWYAALPAGLDTPLAPGSGGVSAGEAQLLALARIFLRDPSVVILDEASSRLDPTSEAQVHRAIDRLLDGRTGVIIAHRLATVRRVDDVLVLEDGRVREYGPRGALSADPTSRFARLLRTGMEEVLA